MERSLEPQWIAETEFDLVPLPGNEPIRITVRIGRPVLVAPEDVSAFGRCPIALVPLGGTRWIQGNDEFQALCLALQIIRVTLQGYVAKGWRVLFPDTDSPIDLDSPSFVPIATQSDVSK